MDATVLEKIEADICQLSFPDQLLLIERLAHRIRAQALPSQASLADELAAMANDSDIQRELRQIETEFADTETDGLSFER